MSKVLMSIHSRVPPVAAMGTIMGADIALLDCSTYGFTIAPKPAPRYSLRVSGAGIAYDAGGRPSRGLVSGASLLIDDRIVVQFIDFRLPAATFLRNIETGTTTELSQVFGVDTIETVTFG